MKNVSFFVARVLRMLGDRKDLLTRKRDIEAMAKFERLLTERQRAVVTHQILMAAIKVSEVDFEKPYEINEAGGGKSRKRRHIMPTWSMYSPEQISHAIAAFHIRNQHHWMVDIEEDGKETIRFARSDEM